VRCYEILRQRSLTSAVGLIVEGSRSCSANFLIAQPPDVAVDVETAPHAVRKLQPTNNSLVHTNHFLDPAQLDVVEPPIEPRPHSYTRLQRMSALLEAPAPVTLDDLERALRDHAGYPDSICRHESLVDLPEERCKTVTSVIMDLEERCLRLTDGQPCEQAYAGFCLPHL
jgi:isopenicillin-N N-acyltransferase-like protein